MSFGVNGKCSLLPTSLRRALPPVAVLFLSLCGLQCEPVCTYSIYGMC